MILVGFLVGTTPRLFALNKGLEIFRLVEKNNLILF